MMAMPQPNIPPVLQPGAGSRSPSYASFRSNSGDLSGDLFFNNVLRMPVPQVHHPPQAPQIRQTVSAPPPPLPKKPDFDVPPLPPKPTKTSPPGSLPLYPQPVNSSAASSGPSTSLAQTPRSPVNDVPEKTDPAPLPAEEELDVTFQAALEQSRRDAEAARRREEEELARAMAESLTTSPRREAPRISPVLRSSRSSYYEQTSSSGASTSSGLVFSPPAPRSTNPFVQTPEPISSPRPNVSSVVLTSSPPSIPQQILDDEAVARQIAEEEERLARDKQDEERERALANAKAAEQAHKVAAELALPPEYEPANPSPPISFETSLTPPVPEPSSFASTSPAQSHVPSPDVHRHRSTSANTSSPLYDDYVRTGRSQSFGAYGVGSPGLRPPLPHSSSTNGLKSAAASSKLPSVSERANSVSSHTSDNTSSPDHPNGSSASPGLSDAAPRPPSQYVDTELLRGVCEWSSYSICEHPSDMVHVAIGFNPPAISAVLTPLDGLIPNVIALPYGRAPPLHIKAPNWRDMLKLMARLSSTRLEPTVEAMAVVKTTMHLRVVVNFVKVSIAQFSAAALRSRHVLSIGACVFK